MTVTDVSSGSKRWRLANPNDVGAPLVFLVLAADGNGWRVRVPARPNGAVGWVADADVEIQYVEYSLRLELSRHRLTLYRLGQAVDVFRVGVGSPDAPTPTGRFFLTELLQPKRPTGPYGAFAYGLSAFSDVYSEFEGGPGQVGLHGTNDATSIGRSVSHGCIRLAPRDLAAMVQVVPAGTPITIVR